MKSNVNVKAILAFSILFLLPILILVTGVIRAFALPTAIGSLLTYWLLASFTVLIMANLRQRRREILLLVLSAVATITISELAVRYLFPFKAMMHYQGVSSKRYHHIYPPNKDMYWGAYGGNAAAHLWWGNATQDSGERQVVVRTNEDGLRSHYSRQSFLDYKTRIAVLGDSFPFGFGVNDDSTFPALTETLLRKYVDRTDIAVLNAGIVSYSPFLSDLLFRGILKHYHPTVVLLFLDATDIGDDITYTQEANIEGDLVYFDVQGRESARHYGALYELSRPVTDKIMQYIKYPYYVLRKRGSYDYYTFEVNIDGIAERNRFFIYRHSLEKTRPYFINTLNNINKIAARVKKHGGRFVLVITPRFHHWNQTECPNNWERDAYSLNEPFQYEYFRFFEEIRDQVSYRIFNMLPRFQETAEFPLVFDDDPHWNEKGHAFVAKTLTEYLIRTQVVE